MASFGEELRRERELRDISLREIAEATNISVRVLESLERNDFTRVPGGVYLRGFIRAYAGHIGLDPEETLNGLQMEMERQERESADQPLAGPAGPGGDVPGRAAEGMVVVGLIAVALLIGGLYWYGALSRPSPPPSDPALQGAALKARFKKSGAVPPLPSTGESAPVDLDTIAPAPGSADAAAPAERLVGIRALETTRVQLSCGGVVAFKDEMWVGVERQFPCREPILLSATNGAAIEYSVDSSGLRPLGRSGEIVREREIPFEPEAGSAGRPAGPRPAGDTRASARASIGGDPPGR